MAINAALRNAALRNAALRNAALRPPPTDATLNVMRAAQVLGVHPNTVRTWSDAGRLRYYRINSRGDRRYRTSDLNRFLAGAAEGPAPDVAASAGGLRRRRRVRTAALGWAVAAPHETGGQTGGSASAALEVMAELGRIAASVAGAPADESTLLGSAARAIRDGPAFRHVSVWRLGHASLDPIGIAGPAGIRLAAIPAGQGSLGAAIAEPGRVIETSTRDGAPAPLAGLAGRLLACSIPGPAGPWGALIAVTNDDTPTAPATRDLLPMTASAIGSIVRANGAAEALERRIHWSEAIGRIAVDIGSRHDPNLVVGRLVDHVIAMFEADRASIFLFGDEGSRRTIASRGLSSTYQAAVSSGDLGALTTAAVDAGRPVFAVGFRDDPRAATFRASVVQEGFDSICVAPLIDGESGTAIGSLNVYHDRPHHWAKDELDAVAALAAQAAGAIRSSAANTQLATWASQLQSIQQLGVRLNRLSDVSEIGTAIAVELNQLIDYHNVRVYRQYGDDLIPVAMRGQVGEYVDETAEQLRVKVGYGITGWVAANRVAVNLLDAAKDPRANTIPGTEGDLDESMLLAPMLFEDRTLGVIVLAKLGLAQFNDDDLRLLVIYASFAAQAMANADGTQRLRRQVKGQRDLLAITESFLATLDTEAVLKSVSERLSDLVVSDNLWIELLDRRGGTLEPVIANGVSAVDLPASNLPGQGGVAGWVMEHNEPVLLADQFEDPRVLYGADGPVHGGLICVPIRGRAGAIGTLALERLGVGRAFAEEEYELVQQFAAQVSVAVQNAQAHAAISRQAETDDLTGLRNHRSFRYALDDAVARGEPFSLLMVDLDRFKLVNDQLGHAAGNEVLRLSAGAIVRASRDSDAVFRYGGDEFVVLLSGTDAAHVGPVADRIRSAFADPTGPMADMRAKGVDIDASAGVATYPTDGATPEAVLLAADRALFVAKRDGGGRVATALEGEALAGELTLQAPTPIDL